MLYVFVCQAFRWYNYKVAVISTNKKKHWSNSLQFNGLCRENLKEVPEGQIQNIRTSQLTASFQKHIYIYLSIIPVVFTRGNSKLAFLKPIIKSLELCPPQFWNAWGKFSLFIIFKKFVNKAYNNRHSNFLCFI